MKETDDDELQQWLENRLPLPEKNTVSEDAAAYRTLFEILDDGPAGGLPYNFAAKVTRRIEADEKRGSEVKYYILAALIFIATITAACSILTLFNPKVFVPLMNFKWIIIAGPVVFMAIQYLDLKLVKGNIFRN